MRLGAFQLSMSEEHSKRLKVASFLKKIQRAKSGVRVDVSVDSYPCSPPVR
jgi:hypothetical protein